MESMEMDEMAPPPPPPGGKVRSKKMSPPPPMGGRVRPKGTPPPAPMPQGADMGAIDQMLMDPEPGAPSAEVHDDHTQPIQTTLDIQKGQKRPLAKKVGLAEMKSLEESLAVEEMLLELELENLKR